MIVNTINKEKNKYNSTHLLFMHVKVRVGGRVRGESESEGVRGERGREGEEGGEGEGGKREREKRAGS